MAMDLIYFGISLIDGVLITVLDTFCAVFLINKGIRKMEAFIITLVLVIGVSFIFEMIFAQPEMDKVLIGLIRCLTKLLYTSPYGIIGATVMPHNLYYVLGANPKI
jgi:manganese transport protein